MLSQLLSTSVVVGPVNVPRPGVAVESESSNPGLGGAEFEAIQLAFALERSRRLESVSLWMPLNKVELGPSRISQIPSTNGAPSDGRTVLITSCSELLKLPRSLTRGLKIIAWSHHPHDETIRKVAKEHNIAAVVSVGQYAYHSNQTWAPRSHVMLRNLISPLGIAPEGSFTARSELGNFTIGHISSLHPSKGFSAISRAWPKIHKEFPEARLEVIGGRSLYGDTENHPLIPMDYSQGEAVLRNLGESISTVHFLGRIDDGVDKVMARWRLGLLNPSGKSEADPASFKDMARAGVPVLAGYDYGLSDFLHDFPDLRIRREDQIADRAISLLRDEQKLSRISKELIRFAGRLVENNKQIEAGWLQLLLAVAWSSPSITRGFSKSERAGWRPNRFAVRIWLRNLRLKSIPILRAARAFVASR